MRTSRLRAVSSTAKVSGAPTFTWRSNIPRATPGDRPEAQRVSQDCRRALRRCLDRPRFDFDVLTAVSGLDDAELLDAMDEAERLHLVTSGDGQASAMLMFTHELIRRDG
jgi:hypothetical protein